MKTHKVQELYALRSRTVEPLFGNINENKGMLGFLKKVLKRVRTEFHLACIVNNLRKIKGYFIENNRNVP